MKRASSFDPLPHVLSTKGLVALVAIVVLGTAVTVQRYLDSSRAAAHRSGTYSALERPGEVRASAGDSAPSQTLDAGPRRDQGCKSSTGWCAERICPRVESAGARPTQITTPSIFQPDTESPGS